MWGLIPVHGQAMDVFIAGDDVPKLKPDPIIYKIAAERLGVKPEECLVIEDSTVGYQVAFSTGILSVIIV